MSKMIWFKPLGESELLVYISILFGTFEICTGFHCESTRKLLIYIGPTISKRRRISFKKIIQIIMKIARRMKQRKVSLRE